MPSINLKSVVKRFGKITALKGVDLDLKDGEFFVLVGPTGAGKTTTLRVVAGLEKIDEGDIFIGEENARDLTPAERDVAFVYQSFSLYPQMSVRKNLEFPLRSPRHREPEDEINKRVDFVANTLHIPHLLDRMPDALSGGEMQRVGIGRAIIRRPQVFLMDEPLSDLDAKLREELRVELRQLQQNLGTTTLYVTHDQIEAMSMGDRIAVLSEGIVHQIGTPNDVYRRPADLFVAGFIGNPKMNFFTCAITDGGSPNLELEEGLLNIPVSAKLGNSMAKFQKKKGLILGIRPEAVHIHKEKGKSRVEAEVLFLEHFGAMNIINLQIKDKIIKARTHPTQTAHSREKVWIEFEEEHILFFDRETKKAISN
jgi:multiple sugar transport system ATP-binding protein